MGGWYENVIEYGIHLIAWQILNFDESHVAN